MRSGQLNTGCIARPLFSYMSCYASRVRHTYIALSANIVVEKRTFECSLIDLRSEEQGTANADPSKHYEKIQSTPRSELQFDDTELHHREPMQDTLLKKGKAYRRTPSHYSVLSFTSCPAPPADQLNQLDVLCALPGLGRPLTPASSNSSRRISSYPDATPQLPLDDPESCVGIS